jgi:hypothetical protein
MLGCRQSLDGFYRNDHFGNCRALLHSADGGKSWKLAETKDFQ